LISLPKRPVIQTPPGLSRRAAELRADLQLMPAELLAAQTGSNFLSIGTWRGEFHFSFFESAILGSFPELRFYTASGDELADFQQALLLYYFFTADGTALSGTWVSFADLPDGRMYNQAFQGYSGNEVVKAFGMNLEAFETASSAVGGQPVSVGDASFRFQALPCVPLLLTYWLGDEDFPSSCKVLFDSSAGHYLPIAGCAILGSQLVQKVIKRQADKKR
jgi:hypothetical protein